MFIFVIFFLFATSFKLFGDVTTIAVSSLSMASSLNDLSSKKKGIISKFFASNDEFCLEQVMLVTKADMNEMGALKVHMVIVYDREVIQALSTMSSNQYFQAINQLVKDFPDKLKIFEWELVAKDRIIPWTPINYPNDDMTPIGGFVFASYSNSGEHRARIPNYAKLKITFGNKDFTMDYEDKDDGSENEDED